MERRLHFISGLPRSGSTLLAAILRQNPRFHAGVSSPLASLFQGLQGAFSNRSEGALLYDEGKKCALFKAIFSAYYHDVPSDAVIFDTNRIWPSKMPILAHLFPAMKMLCCVRDLPWIIDSIERLIRGNIFDVSGIFDYEPGHTVYTRVERLVAHDGLIGSALDALRDGFYGAYADRMLVIDYEALVRDPGRTISVVYDFLGEAPFAHDFENTEYSAEQYDKSIGTPGLHVVRPRVEWLERKTVLPPEIFSRFASEAFWKHPPSNPQGVRIVLHGAD